MLESDLIDYTPAIKDSALKLAKLCRMGLYYLPASPADGKGKNGPAQYKCSWYAPGAAGGVNIDGGAAVDPETGMLYVGSQSGMSTIAVQHDPCSELAYTSPHNSCGKLGALPPPPGVAAAADAGGGGFRRVAAPNAIGGISIFKPKELGGITAYDLTMGDKIWWKPNGDIWRDPPTTTDPLFSGVTLPKIPHNTGQPEIITTKTLLINGTGRGGYSLCTNAAPAGGGRAGRGGGGGGGGGGRGGAGSGPLPPPALYAFDKATGKLVGSVQIPQVNTAVPMTFLHQGKQYIVFASGAGDCTKLIALTLPGGQQSNRGGQGASR